MNNRAIRLMAPSLSALMIAAAFALPAAAQENQTMKQSARIAVTGEGKMNASPDMAILNLTVLREAKTAREAMSANNEAMSKVLDAMKSGGIEDRDLQTGGINIQPRYIYPDDKNDLKEPRITSYTVSNSLVVRVRDLTKLGTILDESVTLGVNQGGDLTFVNDNPAATINEARKRAVADAIAKAKTLADAAGVGLGRVIEINEQSRSAMPVPIARQFKTMAAAAPEDSVPLAAGENTYNVSVNITFEINQ
ncbi:SIMPL domain-containing protein [Falsochrobactrum sp. TDYN1]|uniref:SIMPL domain-containing protein n=1 Tax=Falsochrobactrum tianjinense TaxID=2706015 RepID=A0A949UTM5_9HYPH|nr:SIMPL domain-containing protein [Falsochrobactrum sp. TDYN1]MBV2143970.1 SIMPL domain-containing protein [Falsochrobactrum sp. TDYN1]